MPMRLDEGWNQVRPLQGCSLGGAGTAVHREGWAGAAGCRCRPDACILPPGCHGAGLTAPLSPPLPHSTNCPQVQFNLADFVKRAYGTNYVETLRVQVGAHELPGVEVCAGGMHEICMGGMQGRRAACSWPAHVACGPADTGASKASGATLLLIHPAPATHVPPTYVVALQVHANCRIRRIYFSDRLYSEAELPPEFKVGCCCWDGSGVLA